MNLKTKSRIILIAMCFSGIFGGMDVFAYPPAKRSKLTCQEERIKMHPLVDRLCKVYGINFYELDFPTKEDAHIPRTDELTEDQISELDKIVIDAQTEGLYTQVFDGFTLLDCALVWGCDYLAEQLIAVGAQANRYLESPITVSETEKNRYLEEYLQAVKHIIPRITKVETDKMILQEELEISPYVERLDKFEKNVMLGLTRKYRALVRGLVLNHEVSRMGPKMTEMFKGVPQGGNWRFIPDSVRSKSKRLARITNCGSNTTHYGRIDYGNPSYTITTCFRNPGNGTTVHPTLDRLISTREAARFQSFKDSYYFFGNLASTAKQVGNAVPPILAYHIGKRIKDMTGCCKSVDLFCGVGGLAVGFKAAGIKSVLCNDFNEDSCITIKINNPEADVLCGDIQNKVIKSTICRMAKLGGTDIICGGPPCQGFSLAGKRKLDDSRNRLFEDFIEVVHKVQPKVVVFENVVGLLSHNKRKTYKEILEAFDKAGYNAMGRILTATEYGVPQKRRRVIVICTRKDMGISPSDLYPEPVIFDPTKYITAWETISDLEYPLSSVSKERKITNDSAMLRFLKGEITYDEFLRLVSDKKDEP